MMHALHIWAHAARPKTLIASISPALIGAALCLDQGDFQLSLWLWTLCTGLLIQVGTNLANDYFDFIKGADTAERKGGLRVTQAGLVSSFQMKVAIALTFSLAFLCGSILIVHGGMPIACMLILYIALGILYTAGPMALAYLGLGDLLVLLFYGPGAVLITTYLQTGCLSKTSFWTGLAPGAISMAILTVNNIRDIEEDRKANKKTLIVRFGKTFGKWHYLCSLLLALLPALLFYPSHPFILLTLLIFLPALPLIRAVWNCNNPVLLNPVLGKTGQLLWLYTLLFCIGWIL